MIIMPLIPKELGVSLSLGPSVFFIIGKFTFAPHLSWVFCLFPIWLPLHEFGCVYTDFEYANNAIIQDYIKTREIEVEYMPPQRVDTPKTVLSTPNPPNVV